MHAQRATRVFEPGSWVAKRWRQVTDRAGLEVGPASLLGGRRRTRGRLMVVATDGRG
jgi:hypothetical protein